MTSLIKNREQPTMVDTKILRLSIRPPAAASAVASCQQQLPP